MKEWTKDQTTAYYELVEWSRKAGQEGAKKLLSNIGQPQETCSCLTVFNVQDDVAFALRRGAIRILNQLNGINDTGGF